MLLCIDFVLKKKSTILYVVLQDFFFSFTTFFFPRKSIKECRFGVGKSGLKSRSQALQLGEGGSVLNSAEARLIMVLNGAHFPYKAVNRTAEECSAGALVPGNHR